MNHLIKLAEECNELAKEALKQHQGKNHKDKLEEEIGHAMFWIDQTIEIEALDFPTILQHYIKKAKKKEAKKNVKSNR